MTSAFEDESKRMCSNVYLFNSVLARSLNCMRIVNFYFQAVSLPVNSETGRNFAILLLYVITDDLTDPQLFNLSKAIANEADLFSLALTLGVDHHSVETHIYENKINFPIAAYYTLRAWRNTKESGHVAYVDLCEALKKTKMTGLIDLI